jgi:glutathione S-transferase
MAGHAAAGLPGVAKPAPPELCATALALYSFRRCPYAMRARLALQAAGVDVVLREVALKNKPAEMLLASPKGTVPVLVLPGARVVDESLGIMLWALQQNDPLGWLPSTPGALEQTWADIAGNDGPFKQALDRYKYPQRFGLADGLLGREQGAAWLQQWEARLTVQAFLNGDHWGLLDAALAPFVRQFAHTDPHWFAAQHWPRLQRWLAVFEASPALAGVMEKVPVWRSGDVAHITRFADWKPSSLKPPAAAPWQPRSHA